MVKTDDCPWPGQDPLYRRYHDQEWGIPCRDGQALFELLVLESFQAGLSWLTILRRRVHFRAALHDFEPARLARLTDREIDRLLENASIIRHRGKLEATRSNARQFLALGSNDCASEFLWSFVGGAPIVNRWRAMTEVPAQTDASIAMAKALRAHGFRFVGPTTCYAFMQAAGMVNDHLLGCARHAACIEAGQLPAADNGRCVVE